jgi:hypothetical protein
VEAGGQGRRGAGARGCGGPDGWGRDDSPRLAPSSTRTTMAAAHRSSSKTGAGDREPISLTGARGGSRKGGTERGRREKHRCGGGRSGSGQGREILRWRPAGGAGRDGSRGRAGERKKKSDK